LNGGHGTSKGREAEKMGMGKLNRGGAEVAKGRGAGTMWGVGGVRLGGAGFG
jgi:hypothetical protein